MNEQQKSSEQQEWTPEITAAIYSRGAYPFCELADAHNAALAAERQRLKRAQDFSYLCHQQLLSALAAIEKHDSYAADKCHYHIGKTVDLSVLREHDTVVRKPLVEALELISRDLMLTLWHKGVADDALAKVKDL